MQSSQQLLKLTSPMMRGDQVLALQRDLNKLGYSLNADGIFGEDTQKAVVHFQGQKGLSADGIVGPNTLQKIQHSIQQQDQSNQHSDPSNAQSFSSIEELIIYFESSNKFYSKAYLCPAKVLTIGFGHTKGVYEGMTITEEQAYEFLREDMQEARDAVEKVIKVPLNQNQTDALVSFAYNLGIGNLQKSTLARRLNQGDDPNTTAIEELPKWVKGGGKTLPGLVKRRNAEIKYFCK